MLIRFITAESCSVVTSPTVRFSAMSRSSRRMILPERVLGSSWTTRMRLGFGDRPDLLGDVVLQLDDELLPGVVGGPAEDDERDDALAGHLVGGADHRGLGHGHGRVRDERGFHLGGGDPVPGHVHHVIDPAQQPQRAVGVVLGAVTGEELPGCEWVL